MSPHPERRGPRRFLTVLAILAALATAVGVLLGDAYLNGLEAAYERALR